MATITKEDVIQFVEQMSVLELADMIKELEEKFGVSAAAYAAPAAVSPAGALAEEEEKPQTEFSVILTAIGERKIQVIKAVREITGLGLREAKAVVDAFPKAVKERVSEEEANQIKAKLEEAGATLEVK